MAQAIQIFFVFCDVLRRWNEGWNGAIAGLFPVSFLEDPAVAARLEGAIASVMAANEPGIGDISNARRFGDALLTGNPAGLRPSVHVQRFGLDSDADIVVIRNGQPYQSKQEFIEHFAQQSLGGKSAEVAWGNFAVSQPEEVPPGDAVPPPADGAGL